MGCEVVSVYADEMLGQVGFPEQAMQDLVDRDHLESNQNQQHLHLKSQIKYLYGFNQSYTASSLQTVALNSRQYLVYNALNFIVLLDVADTEQKLLSHQEEVVCMEVNGKMCVSGCVGGKISLWDLDLQEEKLALRLPKNNMILQNYLKQGLCQPNPTMSFSAIALTKKFIICADTSQPHNIVYCFDIQTGKLLGIEELPSLQPTFRGIGFGEHHLVTVGADGVWFNKFSSQQGRFQVTKGMFGGFPKTSMCCLTKISNEYVISGGVDGYIFIWSTSYHCKKVFKIFDCPLLSVLITDRNIFAGGLDNKTKCLSYQLLKPKQEDDPNAQVSIELKCMVLAIYESMQPVQNIACSKLETDFCYLQTRGGQIFNRIVPSSKDYKLRKVPLVQQTFINLRTDSCMIDFQIGVADSHSLSEECGDLYLWSASYGKNKDIYFFHFVKVQVKDLKKFNTKSVSYYQKLDLQVVSRYQIRRDINERAPYAFCPDLEHVCHIHTDQHEETDTIHVFECTEAILNDQLANSQQRQFTIEAASLDMKQKVDDISYVKVNSQEGTVLKIYLAIQQAIKLVIFEANRKGYELFKTIELPDKFKEDTVLIPVEKSVEIYFDKRIGKWMAQKGQPGKKPDLQTEVGISWDKVLEVHHGEISNFNTGKFGLITVGNGKLIQWCK